MWQREEIQEVLPIGSEPNSEYFRSGGRPQQDQDSGIVRRAGAVGIQVSILRVKWFALSLKAALGA